MAKTGGEGETPGREIFTPASLAVRVQEVFDREIGTIWVEGEIAELSRPSSGHAYFSLKDREARLKAVMWKGRRLYAGSALTEGLTVVARGCLSVYAPRGDFQLVVDYLEPKGEGALRLAFEKLKAKLEGEGLFNPDRKRPLPFWPRRVAVISSTHGAAARDFIQTARLRRPGADISLYPVRVQGEGAAREIVEALNDLNAWGGFDLIVLTRGGGSLSDLWTFNEEAVARAVAASRTATLAAIGHSTDLTLAELAADQRAITPTAAAEAVFRDESALRQHLSILEVRLTRSATLALDRRRERLAGRLERMARRLADVYARRRYEFADLSRRLGRFEDRLDQGGQRLNHLTGRLAAAMPALLDRRAARLEAAGRSLRLLSPTVLVNSRCRDLSILNSRLARAIEGRLAAGRNRLAQAASRLNGLSPENVLKRGYALIAKASDGAPVSGVAGLAAGDRVTVRMADGRFTSIIDTIEGEA